MNFLNPCLVCSQTGGPCCLPGSDLAVCGLLLGTLLRTCLLGVPQVMMLLPPGKAGSSGGLIFYRGFRRPGWASCLHIGGTQADICACLWVTGRAGSESI